MPGRAAAMTTPTARIELREARTPDELSAYQDLCWRVLRKPWERTRTQRPVTANGDLETSALVLTAWDGDRLTGGGRIEFPTTGEGQVRGMAVDPDYQGEGIGTMILRALEAHGARLGLKRLVLHGRENALAFYRRSGYECGGESYTSFGVVRHWLMWKEIQNKPSSQQR